MNCSEAEVLIHALIDGELDAGHAREVEAHVATCADCAKKLAAFRELRQAMTAADLKDKAPAALRARIEAALPLPQASARAADAVVVPAPAARSFNRRFFVGGFALGSALSGAIAATFVLGVFNDERQQRITGEVVSAHLRSLQPGHLTDVETSDRHTVKPWFNGKLDVAPPVIDLTAQGFTLIGGRLDDINGETVGAIVYRRRNHVINLFVAPAQGASRGASQGPPRQEPTSQILHGFNVLDWQEGGLDFWAVSDIAAGELDEFGQKFRAGLQPSPASG
jgi:anti-sigma factor RsiW